MTHVVHNAIVWSSLSLTESVGVYAYFGEKDRFCFDTLQFCLESFPIPLKTKSRVFQSLVSLVSFTWGAIADKGSWGNLMAGLDQGSTDSGITGTAVPEVLQLWCKPSQTSTWFTLPLWFCPSSGVFFPRNSTDGRRIWKVIQFSDVC